MSNPTCALAAQLQSTEQPARLELTLAQRLAIGVRLSELRTQRGLSQLEVAAQALGFEKSHAAISRLERGVLDAVSAERLEALCTFFGTSLQELMAECDARREEEPPTVYQDETSLDVAPGFGTRIRTLRQAAGLTRAEMGTLLGNAETFARQVQLWEDEKVTPNPDSLMTLGCKLGFSGAWLITGKRAKPIRPTTGMRVSALMKMHGLTNQEAAHLANLDVLTGRSTVSRITRGFKVLPETLEAVAAAFDVPVSWITPPETGAPLVVKMEQAGPAPADNPDLFLALPPNLNKKSKNLLSEIAELLAENALTDRELSHLRATLLKKVMQEFRSKTFPEAAMG